MSISEGYSMRVLFCIADAFLVEPYGVLQLAAIVKKAGHEAKLCALKQGTLPRLLQEWSPHVIAYSSMSTEMETFKAADAQVRAWSVGRHILRVMGGPHPTYFPRVMDDLDLDAICIGEGDRAFPELLRRFENNESLFGVPNILVHGEKLEDLKKELILDLDESPFIERDLYCEVEPRYKLLAVRGFTVGRGCPYDCSYCHNHAFRQLFKECGKIVRRRSADHILDEMRSVLRRNPDLRMIKIGDDLFAHDIDDWLVSFLERYKREINLPFFCEMRPNGMTEEMARLLKEAGCISVYMSVESGSEQIRYSLLNRGLTDQVIIDAFANARQQRLRTYGNALLALPGTKFSDDLDTFCFAKRLKLTVPTFSIFSPYPKTRLTEFAIARGELPADFKFDHHANQETALNSFSAIEKRMQLNLSYMGTLFCDLPDRFYPLIKFLLRLPLGGVYKFLGPIYLVLKLSVFIFPRVYPFNLKLICSVLSQAVWFFSPSRRL